MLPEAGRVGGPLSYRLEKSGSARSLLESVFVVSSAMVGWCCSCCAAKRVVVVVVCWRRGAGVRERKKKKKEGETVGASRSWRSVSREKQAGSVDIFFLLIREGPAGLRRSGA